MQLDQAKRIYKEIVASCSKIVLFTGAGISTDSGISDYRSKGGLWDRFRPVTIQEFVSDSSSRKEYWRRKLELFEQLADASPNEGHLACKKLEDSGKVIGLITQNIDGLHKKAGSQNVIEIHGSNLEIICLSCAKISDYEPTYKRLRDGEEAPICLDCGGLLKPNTISFGQALDPDTLTQAFDLVRNCDLFIVMGSSLVVEPAASLPATAKRYGAGLIIINREATPLDAMADLVVLSDIGKFFGKTL